MAASSAAIAAAYPHSADADTPSDAVPVPLQQQPVHPPASDSTASTRAGSPAKQDHADKDQDGSQVDVKKAQQDFAELRRQLSRSSSLHRTLTGQKDPEKEGDEAHQEDFDLLEYLTSSADQRNAHGFKSKRVGVIWDKLSVTGAGGMKIFIRTFPDAIKEFVFSPVFMILMKAGLFAPKPRKLLDDFDGCAKPGEMVLVLGRPGSGCTTFLKVIANNRGGYLGIDGDITYGGIPAAQMAKEFRGEVVYNQEDDVHQATLTVAQTIKFALSNKTPGKTLPGETRGKFNEQVMLLLLKMLGITHTKDTLVGSAFVRGVSGGERKRVSIAEMMATRASTCCWDNSSRGLDASTALDYAKSLRILTDVFHMTTFVSLYQAGEGIFEQFDKVLVLDQGRQVYFGPAKEARPYMISLGYADLPRQTSADYLTGCTDPNERRIAEGRSEADVPTTPDAFAEAFKKSDIYARMMAERDEYRQFVAKDQVVHDDFVTAVREDKRTGVSRKSPYTVSFASQIKALVIRQIQIKLQNKLDLYVSFITSIIIALIAGSIYFQLPTTSAGAFTRGGAIFMAVLFNSFQAFNELPTQMLGRAIMWKHQRFAFYPPAAAAASLGSSSLLFNVFVLKLLPRFHGLSHLQQLVFILHEEKLEARQLDYHSRLSRCHHLRFHRSFAAFYKQRLDLILLLSSLYDLTFDISFPPLLPRLFS